MPTPFTILTSKDSANAPRPLVLVSIVALDGYTAYLSTASRTGMATVAYGGNTYQCLLADSNIDAIEAMSQFGFATIPSFSLTLADPSSSFWNSSQAHGMRGARATLTFVTYDVPTDTYSTDAIQWQFICEQPTRKGAKTILGATSKINAQQIKIPSVAVQYTCPWNMPATAAQRQDGADNPDSINYRCGYSPDATGANARGNYQTGTTPFTDCPKTVEGCQARGMYTTDSLGRTTGRFGGVTWVAPRTFVGTQYTTQRTYHTSEPGYNIPNPARYNNPIPWLYGTQWIDVQPLAPADEPNSLRFEAIVCLGDVGADGILIVECNGEAIPYNNSDVLLTWRYVNTGGRDGAPNGDAIFDAKGNPYGSICAIEVVVPAELAAPGSIPTCRVLVQAGSITKFQAIASASASGGEITYTFTGTNTDVAGNPPYTVTIVGNSNPAFNGTFQLSNWTFGPPGTITTLGATASGSGTGGFVVYRGRSKNPIWHLADILIKTGWQYSQFNLATFIAAAAYCDEPVSYTDLTGNAATHPRWSSSFVLTSRIPASQAITMICRAFGLMLASSLATGLAVFVEATLADQQGSVVSGSNVTGGISSLSANGSGATGYLAYLFDESNIDEDSIETTSDPLDQTPNEFSVLFQDEDNQWQQDSLKQIDTDALPSCGNREVLQQLEVLGPCNYEESARLANIKLSKVQNGNPRDDRMGSIGFKFTASMGAVHLATRPGYICGLSWQQWGLFVQPVRITSVRQIGNDGRKWEIRCAWHRDEWYVDGAQQATVPLYNNPFRGSSDGAPIPWKPDAASSTTADPIYRGAKAFAIQQNLTPSANGAVMNGATVSGIRPVNSLSALSAPFVPVSAGVSTSSGSVPAGAYSIMLAAIDSSGNYSLGSNLVNAILSATGQFTISGISWPSGTVKYDVFVGSSRFTLQSVTGPVTATPSSITITSLPVAGSSYGPPDSSFFRFRLRAKQITANGSWSTVTANAMQVTAVNAGAKTITIGTATFATNEWQNRTLTLASAADMTNPSPLFNDVIASNTGTVLTMTSTPTVAVGDWVQVLAQATGATSTTITDTKWVNSVNSAGLPNLSGKLVRIVGGTGAGQSQPIASNTSTAITINGTWSTTPDTTSIFWVEEPQWTYDYEAAPITVSGLDGAAVAIGSVPVDNFLGKSVLIEVLTEDQNGNFAPESYAPWRPIYIAGTGGTRSVTGSTTITPSDGTVQISTASGNVTQALPPASSMPNQDVTITKTNSDANTLTITGALGGDVVLTTQYQSVTFHSDGTNWTVASTNTSATNFVDDETPTVSGTTVTLAHTPNPLTSLFLWMNGVRLYRTTHYTNSGNTATLNFTPSSGDTFRASYRH